MRGLQFVAAGSRLRIASKGRSCCDRARAGRYWSPTFCGVATRRTATTTTCSSRARTSSRRKGPARTTWCSATTPSTTRDANNHQSGSDYRIVGTTTIILGTTIYPAVVNTGAIDDPPVQPHLAPAAGDELPDASAVRQRQLAPQQQRHAQPRRPLGQEPRRGQRGQSRSERQPWSPRLGLVWDPKGDGGGRSPPASRGTRPASPTPSRTAHRQPATRRRPVDLHRPGHQPDAAVTANLVDTPTAIQQMFTGATRNATGICTVAPPSGASFPGVSVKIPKGLTRRTCWAYAFGVSRQIGNRAAVRAEYVVPRLPRLLSQRIDTTRAGVVDQLGNPQTWHRREHERPQAPLSGPDPDRHVSRRARGQTSAATTRCRVCGATSTARTSNSGPMSRDVSSIPEYRQQSWYAPEGDLSADERHRARVYGSTTEYPA